MRTLRTACAFLLAGLSLARAEAQGQTSESLCPASGTVVQIRVNGAEDRSTTWLGADPRDPLMCIGVNDLGNRFRRIAAYYAPDLRNGREELETKMALLLRGQASAVDFDITRLVTRHRSGTRYETWHDTWTRIGDQTITINGKPLHVVRYRRTSEGTVANGFSGEWDLMYDPDHHVFVRSVARVNRGYLTAPNNYDIVSMTSRGKTVLEKKAGPATGGPGTEGHM